jgi:Holliday junction resolvase-like predicted endonuclease
MTDDERMQRIKAEIVATAAEAFAAAQFARFGYDVSVHYGAGQLEYDLIISEGRRMLKISVKGSADGGWNLSQSSAHSDLSTANRANSHDAADLWLAGHKAGTAICLVQLKDVADDALPRAYLAWPLEIAARLKAASGGGGDTILWENYTSGPDIGGAGTVERPLEEWKMTRERVEGLMNADSAASP